MRIIVTGGSGFVGSTLVPKLLEDGHSLCIGTSKPKEIQPLPFYKAVDWFPLDLCRHGEYTLPSGDFDLLIHLAWPKLNNYLTPEHLTHILPAQIDFVSQLLKRGVQRVLSLGTCMEYGMVEGAIPSHHPTYPVTPYGLAKDSLHKALTLLAPIYCANLQWLRVFYLYGNPPRKGTLLDKLNKAVDENLPGFPMSKGNQIRDFVGMDQLIQEIFWYLNHPETTGVFNVCSGKPITVLEFVQNYLAKQGLEIGLEPGKVAYPDYEPFAFWGIPDPK